jgi:hypothetical protein
MLDKSQQVRLKRMLLVRLRRSRSATWKRRRACATIMPEDLHIFHSEKLLASQQSFPHGKRTNGIVSTHCYPSQGPAAVETYRGSFRSLVASLTENPASTQAISLLLHAWHSCRSHVTPYGKEYAKGPTDYIAVSPG